MWHCTYTQINSGDSQLLVLGSQFGNLTPGPSFGHNLCFKSLNGSCELILDIYVPRPFQWYNKLFNPMNFALWRFGSPSGLQLPKWELNWECGGSFPHTFLHSREHEMWFPSSLLAYTFVSPYFGHEPKTKVATTYKGNTSCTSTRKIFFLEMEVSTIGWTTSKKNG